jgi:hypothetical protein
MACPYLVEERLCRCNAVRGLLIPSIFERDRFCRTEDFGECPTYRACESRGAKLPQEVYYALWLPLLEEPTPEAAEESAEPVPPAA